MLYIHVFTHVVAHEHRNGCAYQLDAGCEEIESAQKYLTVRRIRLWY